MQVIYTNEVPSSTGAYSQAIISNNFVFVSGQLPLDSLGDIIASDISSQTKQVMQNIGKILEKAGSNFDKVSKTTIFLTKIKDLETVNDVYSSYFQEMPPARSVIEVSKLPKDACVKIECIAELS